MNKQKIMPIALVGLLLISAIGLTVFYIIKTEEVSLVKNEFAQCLSVYSKDYVGDERNNLSKTPFDIKDNSAIGFVEIWGSVEAIEIDYFDNSLNKVFFKLSQNKNKDNQEFFDYYINLVNNGNSINKIENNELLYAIGALDDNNKLYSRAGMSQKTIDLIEKSMNTGKFIQLRLRRTSPLGDGGAPDNFSFACAIDRL